ncbi:hypothetical protein Fcan01_18836 [Folsomia candida]|uniref:CCHC-type domain-containing protein n=1 Tax=Folsomia candida TaxID=158441 RepID=A0A226DPA1_FOLCA|nr:hypothetical protein Fcan01_18836 [Folsomia candida]
MSEGRRISSRRKVPTDRYGDFVGPPLPRKPRTQSANQTQVEESVSLGLTVKSTTKQRRIDLESKREVAKLESEHREVRKQHQTSELIASGLKKDVDGVMEVILSLREKDEDDDRENKIEQEEVKLTKLIEALRSAEQDRDMKMINLQFSEEALNSKKAILQEEAEVEKLEVELEEEKEQQRKSIEGLSKGDKVELISNWAASAGDHTFAKLLEKKMRISAQNQESIPVDDLGATEKEKKVQPDDDDELISVEEDAESEPEDREELEQLRLRKLEPVTQKQPYEKKGNGHRGQNKQERAMVTTEKWERKGEQRKPNKCTFCEDAHAAWYCPKFKDADVESRWSMVKEKNACYCCLTRGHRTNECKRKRECRIDGCNKLHNRLLHPDNKEKNSRSESTLTTQETVTPNEAEITLCATQDAKVNYNVIPTRRQERSSD